MKQVRSTFLSSYWRTEDFDLLIPLKDEDIFRKRIKT